MKPIKPKKMPKALEMLLREIGGWGDGSFKMPNKNARAILSALEYERHRADAAEKDQATETEAKLKAWRKEAKLRATLRRLLSAFAQALATGEEVDAVAQAREALK